MNYNYILSIIIPVYNIEEYLDECLKSIVCQLSPEIQLIIINDCSTDLTTCICNKYKLKYSNITVIHNEVCKGVSISRNLGLEYTEGKYISFIDGDDLISTTYITNLLFCIKSYDFDMISFNYTRTLDKLSMNLIEKGELSETSGRKVFEGILGKDKYDGYLWNKLFKAEIIKNNQILFPENITIWEDMIFVLQYLKHCQLVLEIEKNLYYYRIRSNSAITSSKSITKLQDKVQVSELFLLLDENKKSIINKQATHLLSVTCIDLLIYQCKHNIWNNTTRYIYRDMLKEKVSFSTLDITYKIKYILIVFILFFKP